MGKNYDEEQIELLKSLVKVTKENRTLLTQLVEKQARQELLSRLNKVEESNVALLTQLAEKDRLINGLILLYVSKFHLELEDAIKAAEKHKNEGITSKPYANKVDEQIKKARQTEDGKETSDVLNEKPFIDVRKAYNKIKEVVEEIKGKKSKEETVADNVTKEGNTETSAVEEAVSVSIKEEDKVEVAADKKEDKVEVATDKKEETTIIAESVVPEKSIEEREKEECERVLQLEHKPAGFWENNKYAREQFIKDYETLSIEEVMVKWKYATARSVTRLYTKLVEDKKASTEENVSNVVIKPMSMEEIEKNRIIIKKGKCVLNINLRPFTKGSLGEGRTDDDGTKYWISISGDTLKIKDSLKGYVYDTLRDLAKSKNSIRFTFGRDSEGKSCWNFICIERELYTVFKLLKDYAPKDYDVVMHYSLWLTEPFGQYVYYDINRFSNKYRLKDFEFHVEVAGVDKVLTAMEFAFYQNVKKANGIEVEQIFD